MGGGECQAGGASSGSLAGRVVRGLGVRRTRREGGGSAGSEGCAGVSAGRGGAFRAFGFRTGGGTCQLGASCSGLVLASSSGSKGTSRSTSIGGGSTELSTGMGLS